jgi:predicted membrane protein
VINLLTVTDNTQESFYLNSNVAKSVILFIFNIFLINFIVSGLASAVIISKFGSFNIFKSYASK